MSSHASSCVSTVGSQLRNPVAHRHAHHVNQHSRRSQARPVSAAAAMATRPHSAAELPPSLRNTTAVLHTAEGAAAYVLGISHVSKESCQHIEELIRLVQPDIVLVELCKDRTGLLVDPDAPPPQTWYTPRFSLTGLPTAPGWPTSDQLMGLLKGTGCAPVSAADIEDNAVALLSTGLFRSVRVAARPPAAASAPAFAVPPSGGLQAVAPLDAIEYMLAPRQLPPVQQLSVKAEGGAEAPAADIQARAQAAAAATGGGVAAYLAARAVLLEGQPENVDVSFEGVEAGKPVALLHTLPSGQQRALTGLEPTAAGGAGAGIESFQRQAPRRANPSSSGSSGSSGIQLGAASKQAAAQGSGSIGQLSSAQFTELVPWSREQLARGAASSGAASGGGNALSSFLTSTYAKYQGAAGRSVGIAPGEAWRVALRAAVAAGASQYHLGDAPADTTAQRLASAILSASLPRILGSLVASVASGIVLYQGLLDSGAPANPAAVAAAAALPVVVALAPVVAPLVEVARFAGLSAREIEDTVRLKEPLQAASADAPIVKLWGEDALLNWPGALEPIITQRDAYMARSIAAAASGRPEGLTPAYVLTHSGSGATLQYAMPVGGEAGACPPGAGAGQYQPLPGPKTVVAIVGTAHVRGMIRQWPAAQQDPSLKPLL
ncbi:TraB domain-containing protein [Chlorella vulgaris]